MLVYRRFLQALPGGWRRAALSRIRGVLALSQRLLNHAVAGGLSCRWALMGQRFFYHFRQVAFFIRYFRWK
jgi:hypothetical protein